MIDRILNHLKERRERVINGDINSIPFSFPRFSQDLPGIETSKYYLISGNTKAGKSQITNFMFLYTPLMYAYHHPDKVRVKIFYFPLEETPENITLRFMSYLLFTLSGIRVAPIDLKSTSSNKALPEEVLELLKSEEYQNILKFYEDNVIFITDERNPTGIWKTMVKYAKATGTEHLKTVKITNKETGIVEERSVFDYYEPKDKDEYVFCLTDHVGLLDNERGYDLRQTINKFSEYMMLIRNKYHYIPVVVQQQSTETSNLEAFKNNKIRPTMAGLADSKYTGKDCTVMLGITCPFTYELPEYLGYDINAFRGNIRFLEVVLNREGESNGIVALYFDGATNYFSELPRPENKVELNKAIKYIRSLSSKEKPAFMLMPEKKLLKDLHISNMISKFANFFSRS